MFKVQTNKLFPNYVFLVSVVTSKSRVHICPFPATPEVLRIFSSTKISSWKAYKCFITSFVSSMCIKSRAGPVWSRLHWRKQSAARSRDHVRINIQSSVSSERPRRTNWRPVLSCIIQSEASFASQRQLWWFSGRVRRQHSTVLVPDQSRNQRQKTSQQFWVTAIPQHLDILRKSLVKDRERASRQTLKWNWSKSK